MNRIFTLMMGLVVAIAAAASSADADDWLRFRGKQGMGVYTSEKSFPAEFDNEKNLNWKVKLPGAGASSPIIVGDRIFVTCYSGYGQDRRDPGKISKLMRHVVCFSRTDGSKLWQKDFKPEAKEDPFSGMGVPEHGYSSSTPVSDGKKLYVFFGKSGVYAFDLDGNQLWKKSVGTGSGRMRWGSGASPVLHNNVLVINATDEANAIVGLNTEDGEEVWKADDISNAWMTPLVAGEGDQATLILSVPGEIWGMNPAKGKLRWYTTNGVQDISVSASPMLNGDKVVAMGGRSRTGVSVKLGGKGDVTKSHTVWSGRAIGRIMTPVIYDGHIFAISGGIATCADAESGEEVFRSRLPSAGDSSPQRRGPSGDYCSPVIVDGKLIQFTKKGVCYVIAAKSKFELLATNTFKDDGSEFNSTPSFADGNMYVRSNRFLYSIGAQE